MHSALERVRIVGQIRNHFGRGVEAHQRGLVLGAHHAVDEVGRGFLLEAEAVANAVACID
jgi:hypothetical protein